MRDNKNFAVAAEYQALKLLIDNKPEDVRDFELTMFSHSRAKALFQAIQLLKDSNEAITDMALLREANKIDDTVDLGIIRMLLECKIDITAKDNVLNSLKDENAKNQISTYADKLKELVTTNDPLDQMETSNVIYKAQEALVTSGQQINSKTLTVCLNEYIGVLNERKKGKYNITGDEFLDAKLRRKAAGGQFILVAGATGTGKSTYALYLINSMINLGIPCLYISLEMDTESTMDRLLSMRTQIPLEEWYTQGQAIDSLISRVEEERELLKDKPFRLVDEGVLSLSQIQYLIRDFKMTYRTDYVCVFIDLVTQVKDFIDTGKSKGNLATTIEVSVNKLHGIMKQEKVCCFGIAQMNRDTDSMKVDSINDIENFRPSINNVKNSGALGERSRVVLSVFRPKYYAERLFPNDDEAHVMEDELQVQILKQSQGSVGVIGRYLFLGDSFSILPKVEEPKQENQSISY